MIKRLKIKDVDARKLIECPVEKGEQLPIQHCYACIHNVEIQGEMGKETKIVCDPEWDNRT